VDTERDTATAKNKEKRKWGRSISWGAEKKKGQKREEIEMRKEVQISRGLRRAAEASFWRGERKEKKNHKTTRDSHTDQL